MTQQSCVFDGKYYITFTIKHIHTPKRMFYSQSIHLILFFKSLLATTIQTIMVTKNYLNSIHITFYRLKYYTKSDVRSVSIRTHMSVCIRT